VLRHLKGLLPPAEAQPIPMLPSWWSERHNNLHCFALLSHHEYRCIKQTVPLDSSPVRQDNKAGTCTSDTLQMATSASQQQ